MKFEININDKQMKRLTSTMVEIVEEKMLEDIGWEIADDLARNLTPQIKIAVQDNINKDKLVKLIAKEVKQHVSQNVRSEIRGNFSAYIK